MTGLGFARPELLLLLLPVGWVLWRWRSGERATDVVRALVALCFVLALAAPFLRTADTGRDLVILVDRSESMPAETDATALELVALAAEERREGDRVAVLAFGADVAVERLPEADGDFQGFERFVDRRGSDLGRALEAALELVPAGRRGAVLLLSDGENNGRDPVDVARRAFARDVRIDVRSVAREVRADLSVERLDLPETVDPGEPFQFTAWVRSDRRVESEFVLLRGEQELSRGRRVFERGLNRLVFRDVLRRPGVAGYTLRVDGGADRFAENDRGVGAVRVLGTRPVLVVNEDGAEDTLVQALRAGGVPVEVAAPEAARLDRLGLTAFRAVVLENVDAGRVGPRALEALSEFVLERGGGLAMTGGRSGFGIGGYHLSAIDELLPVSMEMRQEARKQGIALAVALDRSGSMGVEVMGGLKKMDLANLGTVAAIELLSAMDSVGVIAVDSTDHVVQELVPAEDLQAITSRVRTIRSGGGGIYTYTALVAAARMLEDAPQTNRHVTLFADAGDSEEQEGCDELVRHMLKMGISLSVIALGTDTDSDADFLKRIAALGEGEAYFTTDPVDLPRLFAQDTLRVARSTFVEAPTATAVLPDLFGLGEMPGVGESGGFPTLGGYNLTWLREGGIAGAVTTDEYRAPVLAFAYRGLGRTAAFTGQVGGTFGGSIVAWPGFAELFVTLVRWLAGQDEPEALFASVRREGREAVVSVEVDPEAPTPPDTGALEARLTDPRGETRARPLERTGEHRFEARFPLDAEGVALGSVRLADGRVLTVPPVALPYSPEFERGADPDRGERLLRRVARESGGAAGATAGALFRGERGARGWRLVSRELLLLGLVLLVVEIAARRLQLWGTLASLVRRIPGRARRSDARSARAEPAPAAAPRATSARPPEPEAKPAEAPAPPAEPSMTSALQRARRAARRELDR